MLSSLIDRFNKSNSTLESGVIRFMYSFVVDSVLILLLLLLIRYYYLDTLKLVTMFSRYISDPFLKIRIQFTIESIRAN